MYLTREWASEVILKSCIEVTLLPFDVSELIKIVPSVERDGFEDLRGFVENVSKKQEWASVDKNDENFFGESGG